MSERTNDDLCTPEWVLELVRQMGVIGLDPCSNQWSKVCARDSIFKAGDGLDSSWSVDEDTGFAIPGLVYVNPPYSKPKPWIEKCAVTAAEGMEVLALVKHDPSTVWFKIARSTCSAECDFDKRISFDGGVHKVGMFASTMFYWGNRPYLFAHVFAKCGHIQIFRTPARSA